VLREDLKASFVSAIIPVRNEERFIARCLDSIINNDYPKNRIEILVIDGMSNDGTREIIEEFRKTYTFLRLIDNPKRIVPTALNIGIKKAKGDIIIRMDSHVQYEKSYISKCVEYLIKTNAENVGGPIITLPSNGTRVAEAISIATSHTFGVGNSKFRTSKKEGYVDTVTFGAWPKEIFKEIGLFDEKLIRNQDIELNSRIRKKGGKIYLNPEIKSYYYSKDTLKALWKQNFENGKWNIYTSKIAPATLSWRHFVPLIFVFGIISSIFLFFLASLGGSEEISYLFLTLALFIPGSYVLSNLYFTLKISFKRSLRYIPILPITFATLHFGYGLGSLWGLLTSWKIKK